MSSSVRLMAALSTPSSTSRAASRCARALAQRNDPVSVVSPAYRQCATRQVDRLVPRVEQLGDQHRGRIRRRVDVVGGAEQLVGGVVVDHQHLAAVHRRASRSAPSRLTLGMSTVTTRSGSRRSVLGRDQQVAAGQRLQRLGQLRRCGEADLDGLARLLEHQRQRQTRADGVGVGIHVAHHGDRSRRIEQVGSAARIDAHRRDLPVAQSSDRSRSPVSSASSSSSGSPPDRPPPQSHGTGRRRPPAWRPRRIRARSASAARARASSSSMCCGGVGHLVQHERQRRGEPHTGGGADLGPQRALGPLQRRRGAGVVGLVLQASRRAPCSTRVASCRSPVTFVSVMVTKANGGSLISNSIAEATTVPMRLESRRARPTSTMTLSRKRSSTI